MSDPLLDISGLEAGYETGQVLFGIDLYIEQGGLVSLLGRNGAGKTTTMRAIAGGDAPHIRNGSIRFDGKEILGRPAYDIATMGLSFVPEERRCFPALTVTENIRTAINHARDPRSLDEVLDEFPELEEMREKEARNLSGGEQQMLAIARSLAANPTLMLLDEPFEGLAPTIVRRIEEIIERINETQSVTVLFVEQDIGAAMTIADRHYILNEGRIVREVSTEELRADDELRQRYLGV